MRCQHLLAFVPELGGVGSFDPVDTDLWRSPLPRAKNQSYRLCVNYSRENICNWAMPSDDPHELCVSCRLTRVIPNLNEPKHKDAWYRLEIAKRRLVYSLLKLKLPLATKDEDPKGGLAFELLAPSTEPDADPVFTGHSDGVITINIAEADDVEREKTRLQMHEPYRTLLGHFRHEIGHYYWDRLIEGCDRIDAFRELFGDERESYADAINRHYEHGAPEDWPLRFVSAYASMHPWEDWAETWAHYLHITDVLETATAYGLSLSPKNQDDPLMETNHLNEANHSFERIINIWLSLTQAINDLNRSMGLQDGYPFVLSTAAIDKIRFVSETVADAAEAHREE